MYKEKYSVKSSFDVLSSFTPNITVQNYVKVIPTRCKISKPSDKTVITEDEKKFQEYFQKEKNKVTNTVYLRPVSSDFEIAVNKEIINSSQERIIENEERVPSACYPRQEYLKVVRTRRSEIWKGKKYFSSFKKSLDFKIRGWFMNDLKPTGLKGGGDFPCGPNENHETSKSINEK